MEIKEQVQISLETIKKSKEFFSSSQLILFKQSILKLKIELLELKKEIQKTKDKELIKKINDSIFQSFFSYIEKDLLPLTDKDLSSLVNIIEHELLPYINSIEQILEGVYSSQITSSQINILYSNKYLKKLKNNTYSNNIDLIKSIEQKIVNYFLNGGIPGRSSYAKISIAVHKDKLHALLPDPIGDHRILYTYYPSRKQIIFEDIGTHKELSFNV